MKFKATILLLYSSIAFINIPFVESSALRKGWHSVHTKIDAVFNVTQFMNCVNINGTIINLWETEVGEYLVTPANLEVFELFKWLDCTDEQDIGDLLVVSDGTYLDGLTSLQTGLVNGIISWVAYRHHVEPGIDAKKSCYKGIAYDVFNDAGCN